MSIYVVRTLRSGKEYSGDVGIAKHDTFSLKKQFLQNHSGDAFTGVPDEEEFCSLLQNIGLDGRADSDTLKLDAERQNAEALAGGAQTTMKNVSTSSSKHLAKVPEPLEDHTIISPGIVEDPEKKKNRRSKRLVAATNEVRKESQSQNTKRRKTEQKNSVNPLEHPNINLMKTHLSGANIIETTLKPSQIRTTAPGFISRGRERSGDFETVNTTQPVTYRKIEVDEETKFQKLKNASAQNRVKLDPECDEEVRNLHYNMGWAYQENFLDRMELLVDAEDRVYAVKMKQPAGPWVQICDSTEQQVIILAQNLRDIPYHHPVQRNPRQCPIVSAGNSYGNGQTAPRELLHKKENQRFLLEFLNHKDVKAYLKHATNCFKMVWGPHAALYHDVQLCLMVVDNLLKSYLPSLDLFACVSANLGPRAECNEHRDEKNVLWMLCAIGPLAKNLKYKLGGHLLLHEPRVIIELRHGDLFFLPSAAITHSNSKLAPGDERRSLVLYTAGGLFRWVWQGHRKEDPHSHDTEQKAEIGQKRWELGWNLFPTSKSLIHTMQTGKPPDMGPARELKKLIIHDNDPRYASIASSFWIT